MVDPQLGEAKSFNWLGQSSVSEPIPLMGDIRTNQDRDFAYRRAKSGTQAKGSLARFDW